MISFLTWLPALSKVASFVGKYQKYFAYAAIAGAVTLWWGSYIGREREIAAQAAEARVRHEIAERVRQEAEREAEALRRAKADAGRTADPMRELREHWKRPAPSPHAELDVRPDRAGAGRGD